MDNEKSLAGMRSGASGSTPAPGSPEAVAAGCTCPVLDNSFGKGVEFDMCLWTDIDQGELKHHVHKAARYFWVSAECPLHGQPAQDDDPIGDDLYRHADKLKPAGKDDGDAS